MIQICSDCDSPESAVPTTIPTVDQPNHFETAIDLLPWTGFEFLAVGILAAALIVAGVWLTYRHRDRSQG